MLVSDQARGREFWDGYSDEYQALHAGHIRRAELHWGVWQIPERELQVLGDVEADPYRTVPEAARLLRAGGLFSFNTATPISWLCWSWETDRVEPVLHADYFRMHVVEASEGSVELQLPYGEWIRLFRRNGLAVEGLIELRAPEGATSTYRDAQDYEWARRWPSVHIWKLRKAA